MTLKNRFVALLTAAALAVPALAIAKVSSRGGSEILVHGTAPLVNFTMVLKDVDVKDDGTTTTIEIDGHKFKDKEDSNMRRDHMRKQVFSKKQKWVVTVKNADIEPGLKAKKLPATVDTGNGVKPITITDFVREGNGKAFKVKGKIKTTLKELGLSEICAVPKVGPCVKEALEIDATIALKED